MSIGSSKPEGSVRPVMYFGGTDRQIKHSFWNKGGSPRIVEIAGCSVAGLAILSCALLLILAR